jgi:hypothetical protein
MTELNYLNIDPRAYKYIRETSVRSIYDAFVELITNSIDAYNNPIFNNANSKEINIVLDVSKNSLKIYDNAIGLSGELLQAYFLTVGQYSATDTSRGYFSRGAKDLCAIGNVSASSIKNDKFSQCIINTMGMGQMTYINIPATPELREQYRILYGNGFHTEIIFKSTFSYNVDDIINNLQKHYALRDILSNNEYTINLELIKLNNDVIKQQILYIFPDAEKLIDLTYSLESFGYPTTATFKLFKTVEPMEVHKDDDMKYNDYGILISDTKGIHDNTALHYTLRNNPNITRLYGRIECTYINDLLHQIDQPDDTYNVFKNPYPIINPSRQNGLDPTHPFTKALYDTPYKRILFILSELEDEGIDHISASNINDLINNVEVYGTELINTLNNNYTNFVVVERLVNHIKNDMITQNIIEDNSLPYSRENIQEKMIIMTEGIPVRPRFKIKFSDKNMPYKYTVYKDISSYVMQISLNNVAVKEYIQNIDGEIVGLNDVKARILLSDMITEGLARIMAENDIELINNNELTFKHTMRQYELSVNKIEDKIFNVLVSNTSQFV